MSYDGLGRGILPVVLLAMSLLGCASHRTRTVAGTFAPLGGILTQSNMPDLQQSKPIRIDTWYNKLAGDPPPIRDRSLADLARICPYSLAVTNDRLIRIEHYATPTFTSRLTFVEKLGSEYEISQYTSDSQDSDARGFDPFIRYKGQKIYYEGAMFEFGAAVYWTQVGHGYVEINSRSLGVKKLLEIAKEVIGGR